MCDIGDEAINLGGRLDGECPICWEIDQGAPCPDCHRTARPVSSELVSYALLVLATGTELDRAITYLKDTGSPEKASGRLLLRAAERALRQAGDIE